MGCRETGHHSWCDIEALGEIAIGQPATAHGDRAVTLRLFAGLQEGIDGALVDDRTKENAAHRWVAHLERLRLLHEVLYKFVMHRRFDVDAAVCRALLPAEAERRTEHSFGRLLKVSLL